MSWAARNTIYFRKTHKNDFGRGKDIPLLIHHIPALPERRGDIMKEIKGSDVARQMKEQMTVQIEE